MILDALPDTLLHAGLLAGLSLALLAHWLTGRFPASATMLLLLPGTLLHELAHYLVAHLTGARPTGLELMPRRIPGVGWRLGAVRFTHGPIRTGFVALAPLYLLPGAAWAALAGAQDANPLTQLGVGYAAGLCALAALPSRQDLSLLWRAPLGAGLAFAVSVLACSALVRMVLGLS